MARGETIIDIDIDPFTARAGRWRSLLRIGVPVLGVVLTIAVILVIAVQTTRANLRGALQLADDVLAATDARIAEEVATYFEIPVRALGEGAALGEHEPAGEPRRALVEKFSIVSMKHVPQ